MSKMPVRRITPSALARASQQSLREIIGWVCYEEPVTFEILDVIRGARPPEAFIDILEECSAETRRAAGKALVDVLDSALEGDTNPEYAQNLLLLAEYLHSLEAMEEAQLLERLLGFANSASANVEAAAFRTLSTFANVEALSALEALGESAGWPSRHVPALLRARAQLYPLQAFRGIASEALERAVDEPAFVFALDTLLSRMFRLDGPQAQAEIVEAARRWPNAVRTVVAEILGDEPFITNPYAGRTASLLNEGPHEGESPWRRYLCAVSENEVVPALITGFAEGKTSISAEKPLPAYLRLLRGLRSRVAIELDVDEGSLKPDWVSPTDVSQLLEPHLQGDSFLLDIQWNTEARAKRGQFFRLGTTEAFALVALKRHQFEITGGLNIQPISTPKVAKDMVNHHIEEYRRRSTPLNSLFRFVLDDLERGRILCQRSSAIHDEVLGLTDSLLAEMDGENRKNATRKLESAVEAVDDVYAILKDVIIRDVAFGLIEWNPLSSIPEVHHLLRYLGIRPDLFDVASSDGLVFFPARYSQPLEAGYFYPDGDEEFKQALEWSLFDSFACRSNGGYKWTPDVQDLARHICVVLDPVEQVFSEQIARSSNELHQQKVTYIPGRAGDSSR